MVCFVFEVIYLHMIGLESRAIASTLMNSTSSRSHTVLTIAIEQRGDIAPNDDNSESGPLLRKRTHARILYSKLLMVDLAGSERVRKTISKGTRLDEAKSINTSLSALGNVIAALAESNTAHVPYRDSKLTRILNDSLGGTASTSLIATVGPAPSNYNETLSTLQFASRSSKLLSTSNILSLGVWRSRVLRCNMRRLIMLNCVQDYSNKSTPWNLLWREN